MSLLISSDYNLLKHAKKFSQALSDSACLNPAEPRSPALPCCAHFLSGPDTWLEPFLPCVAIDSPECVIWRRERAKTGTDKYPLPHKKKIIKRQRRGKSEGKGYIFQNDQNKKKRMREKKGNLWMDKWPLEGIGFQLVSSLDCWEEAVHCIVWELGGGSILVVWFLVPGFVNLSKTEPFFHIISNTCDFSIMTHQNTCCDLRFGVPVWLRKNIGLQIINQKINQMFCSP